MHDCQSLTMDDYPCTEAGVIKIGTKYYCQYHAQELDIEHDMFNNEEGVEDAENKTNKTEEA